MKADTQTEAAVIAALEQFQHAAEQGDVESFLATCAPDADIVFIGTGADEKRVGRAELQRQLERDLSQSERLSFDFDWHAVSAAGSVAWVATTGMGHAQVAGQSVDFPYRLTGVLEHRGDQWLWVQMHASVPAAEQTEGQSFPAS
jgi:ketosteroid isomerase-like protein